MDVSGGLFDDRVQSVYLCGEDFVILDDFTFLNILIQNGGGSGH